MNGTLVKVADIAELITKGTTPTTLGYEFQDKGVNFLKIECFDEKGNYISDKVAHISEECNDKLKRSQLKEGDVLFSIAGAIGRVAIVTQEMLPANTNQALAIIRIQDENVHLPYIKLILTSSIVIEQIERKKQGVAQLNLSLKDIGEIAIPMPALEKQKEFVRLFGRIECVINNRKRELEELDNLIKSRFVEMFGNKGENPKGYEEDVLGNLYKFQYGRGNNIPEDKGEYPCYGSNGIVGHHMEFNSEDAPIIGHIGAYAGIVNWGAGKHYVTYNGVICNLKTDRINPSYGFHLLQQQDFNRVATKGGGQPFVSYGDLEAPTVVVPPIEVQNDYAAFASQVDKLKFWNTKTINTQYTKG